MASEMIEREHVRGIFLCPRIGRWLIAMFYLTVFVIPLLFVVVLGILDWVVVSCPFTEWIMDLGWDSHVLAWGALGGVFSNANINNYFSQQGEVGAAAFVCVGVLLALASCLLFLRKTKPRIGWKAVLSLAVGGASLAVPAAIAFLAHM
jgi:hypothetical protein